jgi:predicted aldo/keto reductase-like oxidoreductase
MRYRALGRTGVEVSALGFGCMRLFTAGAPDRIDEAPPPRHRGRGQLCRYGLAKNLASEMKAVFDARAEPWSPAEWSLRFVWNESGVSLLLSGMNDASQLEENLRVAGEAEAGALAGERLGVLEAAKAAPRARTKADCSAFSDCGQCEDICPQKLAIRGLLKQTAAVFGD